MTRLSNGEKRDFIDKFKLIIKLAFNKELLAQVTQELEEEELDRRSRRDAAKEEQAQQTDADHGECPNHC